MALVLIEQPEGALSAAIRSGVEPVPDTPRVPPAPAAAVPSLPTQRSVDVSSDPAVPEAADTRLELAVQANHRNSLAKPESAPVLDITLPARPLALAEVAELLHVPPAKITEVWGAHEGAFDPDVIEAIAGEIGLGTIRLAAKNALEADLSRLGPGVEMEDPGSRSRAEDEEQKKDRDEEQEKDRDKGAGDHGQENESATADADAVPTEGDAPVRDSRWTHEAATSELRALSNEAASASARQASPAGPPPTAHLAAADRPSDDSASVDSPSPTSLAMDSPDPALTGLVSTTVQDAAASYDEPDSATLAGLVLRAWEREVRTAAGHDHPAIASWLLRDDPASHLALAQNALRRQIRALEAELGALPELGTLETVLSHCRALAEKLAPLPIDPCALPARAGARSAAERLVAASQHPAFRALPSWIPGVADLSSILGDENCMETIRACLEWVDTEFGGTVPSRLADVVAGPGETPLQCLREGWRRLSNLGPRLGLGPDEPIPDVLLGCSEHEIEAVGLVVAAWRPVLEPGTWDEAWARLPQGIEPWLDLLNPRQLRGRQTGILRLVSSLDKALQAVEQLPGIGTPMPPLPTKAAFEIDHVVSEDEGGTRAAQVVLNRPAGAAPGYFWIPVRLKTTEPSAAEVIIKIEAEFLSGLPTGGNLVAGGRPEARAYRANVRATAEDWYPSGRDDKWYWDLRLSVPIHRLSIENALRRRSLEVPIIVEGGLSTVRKTLTFPIHGDKAPRFSFPDRDHTKIADMRRMRMGVQGHLAKLESRLGEKSFIVVAPRRFGKSTLYRALVESAGKRTDLVVLPCQLNRAESVAQATQELRDKVYADLHRKYEFNALPDRPLHDPLTWRALLHSLGEGKTLCVFVDEAQALVPHGDQGVVWGSAMKRLIESDQPARSSSGFAELSFVLVGTLNLQHRIGDDAAAFFNVDARTLSFKEDELVPFIRERTKGQLESSAHARRVLADVANNLHTLHRLLDKISETVATDGRLFFLSSDVLAAAAAVVNGERDAPGPLSTYLTSELSQRDREWAPVDSYPVALALAHGPDVVEDESAYENATRWLTNQLAALSWPGSVVIDRVRECVQELQRLGVLFDGELRFRHPLLRALLAQRAQRNPFQPPENRRALERLTVDLLRVPSGAIQRGAGGQAQVFAKTEGDHTRAWRVCALHDDTIRRRFLHTCAAIRALRDTRSHLAGDELLPRVLAAGLDENDSGKGIMTYEWVAGEELNACWNDVPEMARAYVVEQVAGALGALARRGVVHRDISPANIIVDERLQARLIDFGLAAMAYGRLSRVGASPDFLAPDLVPSAASDIWSLGRVLAGPAGKCDQPDLSHLAETMMAGRSEDRPTAVAVRTRLQEILASERFDVRRSSEVGRVQRDLALLPSILQKPLEYFVEAISLRRAGLTGWDELRAVTAAHLLNTAFSTWEDGKLDARWGGAPSLGRLRTDFTGAQLPPRLKPFLNRKVHAVGLMRNAAGHPEDSPKLLQEAEREIGLVGGSRMDAYREALRHTLAECDRLVAANGALSRFVEPLFGK